MYLRNQSSFNLHDTAKHVVSYSYELTHFNELNSVVHFDTLNLLTHFDE